MPARTILLILTCLVSVSTFAQPMENSDSRDVLSTSEGDDSAPRVPVPPVLTGTAGPTAQIDGECNGRSGEWISVDPITRRRTRLYDECQVEKIVGIIGALRGSLGKQDEALLAQIEGATKLLEEIKHYAEELEAELAALRSSKQTVLDAIDSENASTRAINMHNRIVKETADDCTGYMTRIETMFGQFIELEENLDFVKPDARTALMNASTEVIVELETARTELSARWGELQGLHVYEKL
jgi:hypothetical protein